MDSFEKLLSLAQSGDKYAMSKLIKSYMPLIEGLVSNAGKGIEKADFRQYLILKFIENTKKFKKI